MRIKLTPKELVEQTLRLARLFAEENKKAVYADMLIEQLNELETYGYDTNKLDD